MPRRIVEYGVIAAAGKGTRAVPRTSYIPKPLFLFEKETLLERNVDIQVRILKVKELFIIVGHLKEQVIEEIERLRKKYPQCRIHTANWTGRGLAADVASLRGRIDGDFSLILGDEFYIGTNHQELLRVWGRRRNAEALIAIQRSDLLSEIRKNYSVELAGTRVKNLVEKPEDPPNHLLGLGTYVFSPAYFSFFDSTPPSQRSGVVEITDVIDKMARESEVHAALLKGRYFNINSLADYYAATYRIRSEQFSQYRVSLVIPSHNDARTIQDVIRDFRPHVDEILVADMGSTDETVRMARASGAVVVAAEARPGLKNPHADALNPELIRSACRKARGDIVVLTAADGSFRANDMPRLLEYLRDSDMAVGTRTTRQLTEQGANMSPLSRWANVALGKLVELLWWNLEPRFTDVGCPFRAFWKESFLRTSGRLTSADGAYLAEMMIEIVRFQMRCIEIPVAFYKSYAGNRTSTTRERWKYLLSTLRLIFSRRLRSGR